MFLGLGLRAEGLGLQVLAFWVAVRQKQAVEILRKEPKRLDPT